MTDDETCNRSRYKLKILPKQPLWLRRVVLAVYLTATALILLLGTSLGVLLTLATGTVPQSARTSGDDALWLGHSWVDGRRDQADVGALAERLRGTGIRDLFVHIGPLGDDGGLGPALHPQDRWVLAALHHALPGVRVQAWVGDTVGPDHLVLAKEAIRARILDSVRGLLAEGFDGIHYDFEPVPDGDRSFLTLLADSRAVTRNTGAVLSVSVDQIEPLAGLHAPEQWVFGRPHWWSTDFLHHVAQQVYAVAVMTYDSAVPLQTAYSGYVRHQTQLALDVVPPNVDVLIGFPAYHTDDFGHFGNAETVAYASPSDLIPPGDPSVSPSTWISPPPNWTGSPTVTTGVDNGPRARGSALVSATRAEYSRSSGALSNQNGPS
jgi:hypothetical protein